MASKTVIEVARRAAGLSQRRLAEIARTQQSSISEYERRRKSPTLDVVERLLEAADHELAAKPMVFWDVVEDPEVGSFSVPDKLWSVPVPKCFAKVQAFKYVFPAEATQDWTTYIRTWDLSVKSERIDYYQLVVQHGMEKMVEDSVDGLLLIQVWPEMALPSAVRRAWQPLIDGVIKTQAALLDQHQGGTLGKVIQQGGQLDGRAGDDTISGGEGKDRLWGNNGVDTGLKARYAAALTEAILAKWTRPETVPLGARCKLIIRQLPGGEVMDAEVASPCAYDELGRRSIEAAVLKAQPLPYAGFEPVFARTLELNFVAQDR